jgi:hypothetical protein
MPDTSTMRYPTLQEISLSYQNIIRNTGTIHLTSVWARLSRGYRFCHDAKHGGITIKVIAQKVIEEFNKTFKAKK